tara:strand:- start:1148 stop:1456 length:309 start_codon:yes stop_codon:yes gene_type:complete
MKTMTVLKQGRAVATVLATLLLTTGCTTLDKIYDSSEIRIGAMHDVNKKIDGDNPMAYLEITVPVSEKISCGYSHISHWTSGVPFNNRNEQNADTLGCYYKF